MSAIPLRFILKLFISSYPSRFLLRFLLSPTSSLLSFPPLSFPCFCTFWRVYTISLTPLRPPRKPWLRQKLTNICCNYDSFSLFFFGFSLLFPIFFFCYMYYNQAWTSSERWDMRIWTRCVDTAFAFNKKRVDSSMNKKEYFFYFHHRS